MCATHSAQCDFAQNLFLFKLPPLRLVRCGENVSTAVKKFLKSYKNITLKVVGTTSMHSNIKI